MRTLIIQGLFKKCSGIGDLIRYNIEDCLALRRLVQFIFSLSTNGIDNSDEKLGDLNVKYDFDDEIYRRRYGDHEFGKIKYAVDDFRFINKRAYFDYQKNRIIYQKVMLQNSILNSVKVVRLMCSIRTIL